MKNIPILYEDNHLLVVVKPKNMPVCEDESGDGDLLTHLKAYIKEKYQKPGEVYLGLVHRLDRPVGGVMVFARTSKAASRLSDQVRRNSLSKRYMAVVCSDGSEKKRATLTGYIARDAKTHGAYLTREGVNDSKYAELSYARAARNHGLSLMDISLKTGRHHQIRVQLSGTGMPIWGDRRYNADFIGARADAGDIALFAYSLTFEHPTLKERMTFTYAPDGKPWTEFADEVRVLCAGFLPLYVDERMIVIDKPRGIEVTEEDARDGESVEGRLRKHFPNIYAGHRLDATTEGVLVLGRSRDAAEELYAMFGSKGEKLVRKFYECEVLGDMTPERGELRDYITKDARAGLVRVCSPQSAGAQEARLRYRVIGRAKRDGIATSRVEVELLTGRTHQIRVQFAHTGHPIVGDDKYGDREVNRSLHARFPELCAVRVEFPEGRVVER